MNVVVTDSKHDRVELNHMSYESSHSRRVVVAASILENHIKTTVEEVEKVSVTSRLQVTIARVRHMLQSEALIPGESSFDTRIPWDVKLVGNESKSH